MELGLSGRIALVTAASKGLGKAAALSLANEGAIVAICSRDMASVTAAAEELRGTSGGRIVPFVCDVSVPEQIDSLVAEVLKEFGHIDILVNNAGGPPAGKASAMTEEAWERGFELTLMSVVRLSKAVLPVMAERKWGRVVTIASLSAKQPIDDLAVSSVFRPGILGLTKVLANQYGRSNITVNAVSPGYVLTARQEELSRARSAERNITMDQYLAESAQNIPLGRLGRPEEIGDVIAFLCSERAGFITGANIIADGGQTKGL